METKDTVCEFNKCVGCMACVEQCPKKAITIQDTLQAYNAVIDTDKCINCNACYGVCQNNNKVELKKPIFWYQGWASDEKIRSGSSSGGIAAALTRSFIQKGGEVCSCCFNNGSFHFEFASSLPEAGKFVGSKYVKSNPEGIYKKIKETLKNKKNLFIGLPCQVAAIKLFVGEKLQSNLYTCDLICHGTPSPQLLNDYLKQQNINVECVENISFRKKNKFGLEIDSKPLMQIGAADDYLLGFLCSVNYTENCYECRYAGINRGSDITIGDSWGSELNYDEQKKGISLIICLSDKGEELINNAELTLKPVNIDRAIEANDQLRHPSQKNKNVDLFFKNYLNGNFKKAVFRCLPAKCIKQRIKAVLLKLKLYKLK